MPHWVAIQCLVVEVGPTRVTIPNVVGARETLADIFSPMMVVAPVARAHEGSGRAYVGVARVDCDGRHMGPA